MKTREINPDDYPVAIETLRRLESLEVRLHYMRKPVWEFFLSDWFTKQAYDFLEPNDYEYSEFNQPIYRKLVHDMCNIGRNYNKYTIDRMVDLMFDMKRTAYTCINHETDLDVDNINDAFERMSDYALNGYLKMRVEFNQLQSDMMPVFDRYEQMIINVDAIDKTTLTSNANLMLRLFDTWNDDIGRTFGELHRDVDRLSFSNN